jgi:hypothetical protein
MNQVNNNLYTKDKCPRCRTLFISGFDPDGIRECPSCHTKFKPGQNSCQMSYLKYHGANNVYYDDGCPALMSDGRFLTYYNSTNELTEAMRKMNGFRSPNQFRTFMQDHANLFKDAERNYLTKENTCSPATACSEGWYDLWTKKNGYWANDQGLGRVLNH